MAGEIKILREFSENILLTNSVGKRLVHFCDSVSLKNVAFISKYESLQLVVRLSLLPVVGLSWMVLKFGAVPTATLVALILASLTVIKNLLIRKYRMQGIEA